MSDDYLRITTVDLARMARLEDDPAGWRAAVCVDPDGSESLWLLSPEPTSGPGCSCRTCAPHEQLGADTAWRPAGRTPDDASA